MRSILSLSSQEKSRVFINPEEYASPQEYCEYWGVIPQDRIAIVELYDGTLQIFNCSSNEELANADAPMEEYHPWEPGYEIVKEIYKNQERRTQK